MSFTHEYSATKNWRNLFSISSNHKSAITIPQKSDQSQKQDFAGNIMRRVVLLFKMETQEKLSIQGKINLVIDFQDISTTKSMITENSHLRDRRPENASRKLKSRGFNEVRVLTAKDDRKEPIAFESRSGVTTRGEIK